MVNMGGSYHLSSVDRLKSWLAVPQGHGLFLFEQLRHGNCNLGVGDFQLGQGDGSSDNQPKSHNWGGNGLPSAGVNVFPSEKSVKYREGRAHQDPRALFPRKACGILNDLEHLGPIDLKLKCGTFG